MMRYCRGKHQNGLRPGQPAFDKLLFCSIRVCWHRSDAPPSSSVITEHGKVYMFVDPRTTLSSVLVLT